MSRNKKQSDFQKSEFYLLNYDKRINCSADSFNDEWYDDEEWQDNGSENDDLDYDEFLDEEYGDLLGEWDEDNENG